MQHEFPAYAHVFVGLDVHDPAGDHGAGCDRVEKDQPGYVAAGDLLEHADLVAGTESAVSVYLLFSFELEELGDVHAEPRPHHHFLGGRMFQMFLIEIFLYFFLH